MVGIVIRENGRLKSRQGCSAEVEEISLNGDTVRLTGEHGEVTRYKRVYHYNGDTLTVRDARGKDMIIVNYTYYC